MEKYQSIYQTSSENEQATKSYADPARSTCPQKGMLNFKVHDAKA